MIVAFLLMSAILMMSIQTSMATETIETIEVYDSRLDEKEIIKPQSAKASYDYYKTYRTGVSGAYGATGYSKPSVTVSSWSANKMKFKGT